MKFALICAAALVAAPALADELVASNGQDSVRLTDKPCTSDQVLQRLLQFRRESLRGVWPSPAPTLAESDADPGTQPESSGS